MPDNMKDTATTPSRGFCWMDLEIESRRDYTLWHTEIEQRRAAQQPPTPPPTPEGTA